MANRIVKGDLVKVIAGKDKGTTGKVLAVLPKKNAVLVEGIGTGHRHVKPNQLNPHGGKKDIHVPLDASKVALVTDEKSGKTGKVGYKSKDGKKVRIVKKSGKEL